MKLTWLGHSCFKMESNGYTIILDPYEDGYVPGLAPVRETADAVFCSHEHSDHNGRETVTLKQDGVLSPFTITEIHTWHDDARGTKRGSNCIRIFNDGTYHVAHLGDLGCELESEQIEALKGLDAVMIPVGGFYTIDAKQAKALIDQIQPRVTLPMHYRGAVISSIWRVVGVVLACLYILVVQLIIYDFSNHMILMMPLIGLGLAFSARLHVMEKVGAGVGFASITTIGIMFGQNLHPYQDLVFSDLYRITSVTVSLVVTLTLVFLMHRLLNCFAATRFVVSD
mgnify:CR=1 FL=1